MGMRMRMECLHALFDWNAAAAFLIELRCDSGAAFSGFVKRAPKSSAPSFFPLPQSVTSMHSLTQDGAFYVWLVRVRTSPARHTDNQLSSDLWYVHCRWCDEETCLEAPHEEEAYGMLHEWRLSMPRRKYHQRNWSRPRCAEWWQGTTPTATDAAGSAGQPAAKRAILQPNLRWEVQQLKAEVVEVKAEVDKWKELGQRHVAYQAAHVDEIRKVRQEIDQLRAQVTAVPEDK